LQKISHERVFASDFGHEINSTSEALSQTATNRLANLEETTSSMEEMNASISQNTDNSRETNSMAQKAADQAKEGGKAVEETVTPSTPFQATYAWWRI
jgi:methyl-accepting chemotaxis protein